MEIVVRSDAGEAELRLLGDQEHHTLAELAERVLGHRGPRTVLVDDEHRPASQSFVDAGVRRGSVIDLCSRRADRADTPAGELVQIAGHGSGSSIDLRDGSYRLGPTERTHATHLELGTVAAPLIVLHVQGQLVEAEPIDGSPARLAGRPLVARRAWTTGDLVVGDRVFVRSQRSVRRLDEADDDRRHMTPVPIGRSLDLAGDSGEITVDPSTGVGIVADPDDAMAMLRAITLDLSMRSWPHGTSLGIRTAHPEQWDWTKWLAAVDTPRRAGSHRRGHRDDRRRHVVVIDDGSVDEARHRHERSVAVIAAARTQSALPSGLATIVHAVGGDHVEPPPAVSVTTLSDGEVSIHPHVAPYAIDADVALRRARRHARRWPHRSGSPDSTADDDEHLRLVPWAIARTPTALERRIERRCNRVLARAAGDGSSSIDTRSHDRGERLDPADRLLAAASVDPQRIVLPIGFWDERDAVATVPLAIGRRLAIIGRRRADRSLLLASLAESARHVAPGANLFAVAPRGGPLVDSIRVEQLGIDVAAGPAEVADWLERIRSADRPLVFVDGADRVGGPSFIELAGDQLSEATIIITLDEEAPDHHWSAAWTPSRMTIRMNELPGAATLESRNRPRRFTTLHPAHDGSGQP